VRTRTIIAGLTLATALAVCATGGAFDIKGGPEWQKRNGFGLAAGFGGVQCLRDFCDDTWETKFGGSIEGYVGGVYRFMPNVAMYLDFTIGHINTDPEGGDWGVRDIEDDKGMLIQIIVGAAFHVPITGWLDANLGFGVGYVYDGFWAELEYGGNQPDREVYSSYKGLDFELRTGATVYLFSKVPTLGFGPYLRFGFPLWFTACYDLEGVDEDCDWPEEVDDDLGGFWEFDDSPFLVQFGLEMIYGF